MLNSKFRKTISGLLLFMILFNTINSNIATSFALPEDNNIVEESDVNKPIDESEINKPSDESENIICYSDPSGCIEFSSHSSFTIDITNRYNSDKRRNLGIHIQYSFDMVTWSDYVYYDTVITAVQLDDIYHVYFRGYNNSYITNSGENNFLPEKNIGFEIEGQDISCNGNIMTLLDYENPGTTIESDYAFTGLFRNITGLVKGPDLPASSVGRGGYYSLFEGCTSLVETSDLPASNLGVEAYRNMFKDCESLTQTVEILPAQLSDNTSLEYISMFENCKLLEKAPELPSENVNAASYEYMFKNCESLKEAPALNATKLGDLCYTGMFSGCTSLINPPRLDSMELSIGCYIRMFEGCTSLTSAPELPATQLYRNCYGSMFSGCISLKTAPELVARQAVFGCYNGMFENSGITKAPELPATVVDTECYGSMFRDCKSLVDAPSCLPADELAPYCYGNMFNGCSKLINIPDVLPATKLDEDCYDAMFEDCTSLKVAPRLPATQMKKRCYWGMFFNCSSLKECPELPALELAEYCYEAMFQFCTSIKKSCELKATTLKFGCYERMFCSCTSLSTLPELPASNSYPDYCYKEMFSLDEKIRVSETQTPEYTIPWKLPSGYREERSFENMFEMTGGSFTGEPVPGRTYYIGEALSPGLRFSSDKEFKVEFDSIGWDGKIEYSIDDNIWVEYKTAEEKITAKEKNGIYYIYFRGLGNTTMHKASALFSHFKITGNNVKCEGDLAELLDYADSPMEIEKAGCFSRLFADNSSLIKAPECSSITVSDNCFSGLYDGCDGLETVPRLPAINLGERCYFQMFQDCRSITKIESLPATKLSSGCYENMFYGCTSLKEICRLESTELAENCYKNMFNECINLEDMPELPATKLEPGAYFNMFKDCHSLSNLQRLNATELADNCYKGMFSNCTSIGNIPNLNTTAMATSCYESMFSGCTNLYISIDLPSTRLAPSCYKSMFSDCINIRGTINLPATILKPSCYESMFSGCHSLTKTCDFKATTLADSCYKNMFNDCTKLSVIKDLGATTLSKDCYAGMFSGCITLVKPPVLRATSLAPGCYTEMFSNCTNIRVSDVLDDEYSLPWELPSDAVGEYGENMFQGTSGPFKGTPLINKTYYLYNTCIEFSSESVFRVGFNSKQWDGTIEYSTDRNEWTQYTSNSSGFYATLGDDNLYHAYFRGVNNTYLSRNTSYTTRFSLSGTNVSCDGNIMSLLDYRNISDTITTKYCFCNLFYGLANLIKAPELPATTLSEGCYNSMFSNCYQLVNLPDLVALDVPQYAYSNMFNYCIGAINPPQIDAVTLHNNSCANMFAYCSELTETPEFKFTETGESCCSSMFVGCNKLAKAYELPAEQLSPLCYSNMFKDCSILAVAPKLPATRLANNCYAQMFYGCQKLEKIPALPATDIPSRAYSYMFYGCNSLSTLPKLSAISLGDLCYEYMFSNCAGIKVSNVKNSEYSVPWEFPEDAVATQESSFSNGIINNTSGPYTNRLQLRVTYYLPAPNDFQFSSDKPFSVSFASKAWDGVIKYSFDTEKWFEYDDDTTVINAQATEGIYRVYFAGYDNNYLSVSDTVYTQFNLEGENIKCSGDIRELLDTEKNDLAIMYSYAFANLFKDQTALISSPELKCTVLSNNCYYSMFKGCSNLESAPNLPATSLGQNCYDSMFSDCINLKTAPELISDNLSNNCYYGMFKGCTKLASAPELNATSLASNCYAHMFEGCTSLADIPMLPANVLADGCYDSMFKGCNSITTLPILEATSLATNCYSNMFSNCTEIKVSEEKTPEYSIPWQLPEDAVGSNFDNSMLSGTTGPFTGNPLIGKVYYLYGSEYIDFSSEEEFSVGFSSRNWDGTIYYSTDTNNWNEYLYSGNLIQASIGEDNLYHVYYRGLDNSYMGYSESAFSTFKIQGNNVSCNGNVMTLLNWKKPPTKVFSDYGFYKLFNGAKSLVSAPTLMARTLTKYCYSNMFNGCTNLINSPSLPAIELKTGCYSNMFRGCINLETVPDLSAEELSDYCYSYMFKDCASITLAPTLPATSLASNCYENMFDGCIGLETAPTLSATILKDSCYKYMFNECYNLTEAPNLPATELADYCYCNMFRGCSKLESSPNLVATVMKPYCYESMFAKCINLTSTPKLGSTELAQGCYKSMFEGCKLIKTIPKLEATNLYSECYSYMLKDCISIKVSENETVEYSVPWKFPDEASGTDFSTGMFEGTSGPFTGTPILATTYYLPGSEGIEFVSSEPFKIGFSHKGWNGKIKYSTDGDVWMEYTTINNMISAVKEGEEYHIFIAGEDNDYLARSSNIYTTFCFEGSDVSCVGDIRKLLDVSYDSLATLYNYEFYRLFKDAVALTKGPELNFNVLSPKCFYSMYEGCSNLVELPDLSAEFLADDCYNSMFKGCSSIIETPELPANELEPRCYQSMFEDCINLEQITSLPATKVSIRSYYSMFRNCISIVNPPELTSTDLKEESYGYMFRNCESLVKTPDLPADILPDKCYNGMFSGCTKLSTLPKLTATQLGSCCYMNMFNGCSGIKVSDEKNQEYGIPWKLPDNASGYNYSDSMLGNTSGPFTGGPLIGKTYYLYGYGGLQFSSNEPFSVGFSSKAWNGKIEYSTDITDWTEYTTVNNMINARQDDDGMYYLYFRGIGNTTLAESMSKYSTFKLQGNNISCNGDVMQLLDYDIVPDRIYSKYAFAFLFRNATNLVGMPLLGAKSLSEYCYHYMFANCKSLKNVTDLPATELASYCYSNMFNGCTALVDSPNLPATNLASNCYNSMFKDCSSLVNASKLPATTIQESSYSNMYSGCSSLEVAPALPATTLAAGCYNQMFYACSKLKKVPALPANVTKENCYYGMFAECNSLTTLPRLDATIIDTSCYQSMFLYCENIKVSETKTSQYSIPWKFPDNANIVSGFSSNMIKGTTGPFTGDPIVGKTYYLYGKLGLDFSSLNEFTLSFNSMAWDGKIEYSLDGETWKEYEDDGLVINSELSGDSYHIYLRGINNTSLATSPNTYSNINLSGSDISCDGNIMMLLDATTIPDNIESDYAFAHLFENNSDLISSPSLPAMDMTKGCYENMFSNCSGLLAAPELPATNLDSNCYQNMFKNCITLEYAPNLDALTLKPSCYNNMFKGCRNLMEAPELNANKLATNCYSYMFDGCTSIELLPKLKAKELEKDCYTGMFSNCTSVRVSETKTSEYQIPWKIPEDAIGSEFDDLMIDNTSGLFTGNPEIGKVYYLYCDSGIDFNANSDFSAKLTGLNNNCYIEYSTNGYDWIEYYSLINANSELGDDNLYHIYFRGYGNSKISQNTTTPASFVIDGENVSVDGNVATLLDAYDIPSEVTADYAFAYLFKNCNALVKGPDISFDEISPYCFYGMFAGCQNLKTIPLIKTTNVENYSMAYMFDGCKSLENTSEFNIDNLATHCYDSMFRGCTSLERLPKLNATNLASACYNSMFENCTGIRVSEDKTMEYTIPWKLPENATGTSFGLNMLKGTSGPYVGAPSLLHTYYQYGKIGVRFYSTTPFEIGFKNIAWDGEIEYSVDGMTWLPYTMSTNIINSGFDGSNYQVGFRGIGNTRLASSTSKCTQFVINGNNVKSEGDITMLLDYESESNAELTTTWTFANLFRDCSELITTPNLNPTILTAGCYAYMFSGCDKLVELPTLSSTHLADNCYKSMFSRCKSLFISEVKVSEDAKEWSMPNSDTLSLKDFNLDMLKDTSGPFSGDPLVNKTYYYEYTDADYQMYDSSTGKAVGIVEKGCAIDENGNPRYLSRKAFALDLKDIYDYYGKRVVTSDEINAFFNGTKTNSSVIRMCSANTNVNTNTWVSNANHIFDVSDIKTNRYARPAFTLDLAKITDNPKIVNSNIGDIIPLYIITGSGEISFRIIKKNGTKALLIPMSDIITNIAFNDTTKLTQFSDGGVYQQYENSKLDKYLNETFVNNKLNTRAKAALVDSTMLQYAYSLDTSNENVQKSYKITFKAGEGGKDTTIFVDKLNPTIPENYIKDIPAVAPPKKIINWWSLDEIGSNQTEYDFDKQFTMDTTLYAMYGTFKFVEETLYSSASKNSSTDKLMKTKMDIDYETNLKDHIMPELKWTIQIENTQNHTFSDDNSLEIAGVNYDTDTFKAVLEGFATGKRSLIVKYNDIELDRVPVHILFNDSTTKTTTDTFKSIYWASENSMVGGYENGTMFKPTDTATRQQFAIILWRHAGKPSPKTTKMRFTDCTNLSKTSDSYYAIQWAAEKEIIGGFIIKKKNVFKPKDKLTRLQMAIMLYKYAKVFGVSRSISSSAKPYTDTKKFSPKTAKYQSTLWTSDHGIANGYSDGSYGVNKPLQRQQLVIMLYRFNNLK